VGHGTSVRWHLKTWLESVTADLTTTVIHSSKMLINDVKPDHSLSFYTVMYLSTAQLNIKITLYAMSLIDSLYVISLRDSLVSATDLFTLKLKVRESTDIPIFLA